MLNQLDDELWCVDALQPLGPGVQFPARMTIVRLADGLWVHSPIAMDDALAAQINELGPVRHLVAPNCFHHLHMGPASARWPDAKVYAPVGLRAKRSDLRIDVDLVDGQGHWPDAIDVVEIAGAPALSEFVFLHRPSGTLVLCDLAFNMHEATGALTKLVLRMVGAWQRTTQSKLWRRITKDRAAAGRCCERMLALEFSRVIMSHGQIIEGADANQRLRDALEWMLAGK
ncbi:Methanol oxidation glmU-like protein [Enhygromyxa salina]|uniref:Methanol oxidation glmU-like protein n=1 Tax=Enhygromyxa salina TaxID=215803 RepID=A0A0C1ZWM5_9BACT|nr:DUF4336 domain-containing protein [Enhygromyxa salina]KIG15458.1 Methanol oxidation glmU-like protein [Enhygromyxa salina]